MTCFRNCTQLQMFLSEKKKTNIFMYQQYLLEIIVETGLNSYFTKMTLYFKWESRTTIIQSRTSHIFLCSVKEMAKTFKSLFVKVNVLFLFIVTDVIYNHQYMDKKKVHQHFPISIILSSGHGRDTDKYYFKQITLYFSLNVGQTFIKVIKGKAKIFKSYCF